MTRTASHTPAFAAVRGVGLIEVLVALLLISIGMLGLGSLQMNAKRVALESLQRTKALYSRVVFCPHFERVTLASLSTQGEQAINRHQMLALQTVSLNSAIRAPWLLIIWRAGRR